MLPTDKTVELRPLNKRETLKERVRRRRFLSRKARVRRKEIRKNPYFTFN